VQAQVVSKRKIRGCGLGLAVAAGALCGASQLAQASVAPSYSAGLSSFTVTHNPGMPTGTALINSPIGIQSGTPITNFSESLPFTGGSTLAKAGIAHSESASTAKISLASGTGIGQTDPGGLETASSLDLTFSVTWVIPQASTFGFPISGQFSVPVGAKVPVGDTAHFQTDVFLGWRHQRRYDPQCANRLSQWACLIPGRHDADGLQRPCRRRYSIFLRQCRRF